MMMIIDQVVYQILHLENQRNKHLPLLEKCAGFA